jgi:hypothetical protein
VTMTALNETTLTRVLEELKVQNWTLHASPSGDRWRAEPPDPKRKVVTFSSRPKALPPIIAELREQGFRWPPVKTAETVPPAVVRAVPFPPKPHPDVETSSKHEAPPWASSGFRGEPPSAVREPRPSLALVKHNVSKLQISGSPDEAFAKLKDAREYAMLAATERREAQAIFDLAETSLRGAKSVEDDALKQLADAKANFDALFTRPGDP